jgi:hypothetical protein
VFIDPFLHPVPSKSLIVSLHLIIFYLQKSFFLLQLSFFDRLILKSRDRSYLLHVINQFLVSSSSLLSFHTVHRILHSSLVLRVLSLNHKIWSVVSRTSQNGQFGVSVFSITCRWVTLVYPVLRWDIIISSFLMSRVILPAC